MRVFAVAVGGVAIALLAACSLTPEKEPQHLTAATVENLVQGCDNVLDGYPDAAPYKGDGPHTVMVFARNIESDVDLADATQRPPFEAANSEIPDSPLATPDSPRDVQLLACGNALPGDEQLGTCPYSSMLNYTGPPVDIPLYTQLYTFTVYELRTGRRVDTLQLESRMKQPASSCPATLETGATRIYAKAQPYELNGLFESLISGPVK